MRRSSLLLVVALLGGCGWDGPPRDVRVVTSEPAPTEVADGQRDRAPDGGEVAAGNAPSGLPVPPDDPPQPANEDRPRSLGALTMPSTVAVIGDSLTVAATDEITAALTRMGVATVVVDGRESRRMAAGSDDLPSGVAAIEAVVAEHRPDLWVVALGTNDVAAGLQPEQFVDDLRTTIAAIPDTAPLVWVDVWIRDRIDVVTEANALLRAELADRPAPSQVVDWFGSGSIAGHITADGVHLTEDGQDRFASVIADAVLATALAGS